MKRATLMVLPTLVCGCYTYAPIQTADVRPGMGVRARVSATTAERIAPLLATNDARVITGTLIESGAGALIVEVPTTVQAGIAGASQSLHQRVSVAPSEVLELESRRLDRGRTSIVVGAVGLLAISSVVSALRNNDPGTNAPGGGSSAPENKIPLWRWRF
jgi:hypothetical protein